MSSSADAGVTARPAHSGQATGTGSLQAPNARTLPRPAQTGQPLDIADPLSRFGKSLSDGFLASANTSAMALLWGKETLQAKTTAQCADEM